VAGVPVVLALNDGDRERERESEREREREGAIERRRERLRSREREIAIPREREREREFVRACVRSSVRVCVLRWPERSKRHAFLATVCSCSADTSVKREQ
jgi:hypothetical protein